MHIKKSNKSQDYTTVMLFCLVNKEIDRCSRQAHKAEEAFRRDPQEHNRYGMSLDTAMHQLDEAFKAKDTLRKAFPSDTLDEYLNYHRRDRHND